MLVGKRRLAIALSGWAAAVLLSILFIIGTGAGPARSVSMSVTPTAYLYMPLALKEPTPTPTATPTPTPWSYGRRGEYPTEYTVGRMIYRSNACGDKVHGQFGCESSGPWSAKGGSVRYEGINMPAIHQLYLYLRYSKYSGSGVSICVYLDAEQESRACFAPQNQGNWNTFAWTGPIALGSVSEGTHEIRFVTAGQQWGVADLDHFVLSNHPVQTLRCQ